MIHIRGKATMKLDREYTVGRVDERIFSSMIEQLGRTVYDGIYEPGHKTADENGFRQDVIEIVKELQTPLVRYPGGNFVSGYNWQDGVGPLDQRPKRLDLAWKVIESNEVGLNEFAAWAKAADTGIIMAVNLGTGGIDDAHSLVEYCNHPGGTYWSDLRKDHGCESPHNIKVWCLGNEMDGSWQIGQKTADEYGLLANQTAKVIKWIDPSIELVACGSTSIGLPTFPSWDERVLEHAYENIDYLSTHVYFNNAMENTGDYLASTRTLEESILSSLRVCDYVKTKKRSRKDIHLAIDEWGLWDGTPEILDSIVPWREDKTLFESVYTFRDVLVVGSALITLLRHADRVKVACLAQLVNVIAPIMTAKGGGAWRQTIFYPYQHASKYGRGIVMNAVVSSPVYKSDNFGDVPVLDTVAVMDDKNDDAITLFAVNRDQHNALQLECRLSGFEKYSVIEHLVLDNSDLFAFNSETNPFNVQPRNGDSALFEDGSLKTLLPKLSWNVIRLGKL